MKISELEQRSGISKHTIQFYLQKELLHAPKKTGKTMAYYDQTHLKKLLFIQDEKRKGLPLSVIKEKIEDIDRIEANGKAYLAYDDFSESRTIVGKVNDEKSSENRIRKSIIELGCRMFLEKGLKDTRVSDITNSLNIGKGSFYFYFSDKRELFLTCIPLIFEKMFATGWEKVKESKNPLERIKIRGRIIMPFLKEFCAIVQLSKEAIQDEDVKIRNLGIDTYQSIRMPVEADIKNGIRQGLFQDMDPRVASTLMLGMIENIYYLKKIEKDVALDELWDNFTKLMMNGICKEQKTISG